MGCALNCGEKSADSDSTRPAGWSSWWTAGSLLVILPWCWWYSTASPVSDTACGHCQLPRPAMPGDHHRLGPELTAVCARAPDAPVRTIVAVNEGPGPVRMTWQRGDRISAIPLAAGAKQVVRASGMMIALEDGRLTAVVRVNVLEERPGRRGGAP